MIAGLGRAATAWGFIVSHRRPHFLVQLQRLAGFSVFRVRPGAARVSVRIVVCSHLAFVSLSRGGLASLACRSMCASEVKHTIMRKRKPRSSRDDFRLRQNGKQETKQTIESPELDFLPSQCCCELPSPRVHHLSGSRNIRRCWHESVSCLLFQAAPLVTTRTQRFAISIVDADLLLFSCCNCGCMIDPNR